MSRSKPRALVLVLGLLASAGARAETLEVSLVLGDHHSRPANEAAKAVAKELAGRPRAEGAPLFTLRVYPERGLQEANRSRLRRSRLVIVFVMGRQLIEAFRPELTEVIERGGTIYAVGGPSGEEEAKLGIRIDPTMRAYFDSGTAENLKNMILYALEKEFALHLAYAEPKPLPEAGIYEHHSKRVFARFEEYQKDSLGQSPGEGRPWVSLLFYKTSVETGGTQVVDAIAEQLERRGFNVLPIYGYPSEAAVERFLLAPGAPRVRVVVALALKVGLNAAAVGPVLDRLGVPVINAITVSGQSEGAWRNSPVGLDVLERTWQVATPEMAGTVQPTIVAARERVVDPETGNEYVEERPIAERLDRPLIGLPPGSTFRTRGIRRSELPSSITTTLPANRTSARPTSTCFPRACKRSFAG